MANEAGSKDGVTFILRYAYTAASRLDFFFCGDITCGVCVKILDRGRGDISEQRQENNLIVNKRWIVAYIEWHQLSH